MKSDATDWLAHYTRGVGRYASREWQASIRRDAQIAAMGAILDAAYRVMGTRDIRSGVAALAPEKHADLRRILKTRRSQA